MFNVILPTFNESGNILIIIKMLEEVFNNMKKKYILIIVDDNSPDNTSNIVKSLNNPNIKVIDRPGKMGLGSAYIAGLEECIYPYTVIMDSDLQHDPLDIKNMYNMLKEGGYDIVSGTRYSKGGKVCNWSLERCLISCSANNIARFILGINILDLTGSFRLYKTETLKHLVKNIKCKGFGFQMEIIARAELGGYAIGECPIIFYNRQAGESKISWKEMVYFLISLIHLYFQL